VRIKCATLPWTTLTQAFAEALDAAGGDTPPVG
jgi:NifU-like protein involved in Fe-S cluster formation